MCVAADQYRHDGAVHHPQATDAMHSQSRIDDCQWITAHLARARRVKDRRTIVACKLHQRVVANGLRTGLDLAPHEWPHRFRLRDARAARMPATVVRRSISSVR